MRKDIIAARFNENTNWLNQLTGFNIIVYNKGEDGNVIYNNTDIKEVKLQNIGREAHTYLYHIVKNYDNLADYNIFIQASPFEHCLNPLIDINMIESDFAYLRNSQEQKICDINCHPHHHDPIPVKDNFIRFIGYCPDEIKFDAGACFVVSKERILEHSLDYYKELKDFSMYDVFAPWKLERMWSYIFSGGRNE